MGGDEVLEHIEAFTEIGGDRGLDDRAIGLGHQATHARYLPYLCCRATRTRVGHHVDGVERFLRDQLAMAVRDHFFRQLSHHHLGDFVTRFTPNIDHLVVALASRDQARDILLLDLFYLFLSAVDDLGFFWGYQHVVDTNRDSSLGGKPETGLQQFVGKHHRLFEAAFAERDIDQLGDFLLLERLVEVRKRQPLGQNF